MARHGVLLTRLSVAHEAAAMDVLCAATTMLALGGFGLGLGVEALQTWTFVTVVFGNQALLYVLRERGHLWHSVPSPRVFASSAVDITLVVALALSGTLMAPLPWRLVMAALAAATGLAVILDQLKRPVMLVSRVA
jgi:H+-transporting ATPase